MKAIPISLVTLASLLAAPSATLAAVRYVNLNSANPTPPYTNWATAATVIQDAVDAASAGDKIVVTNGVYQTGGDGESRVAVTKPLKVRSVNGPKVTEIDGGAALRCVLLGEGSTLLGFTLTNGFAFNGYGAGVRSESTAVVSNCLITGNSTDGSGGGAWGGTLENCRLLGNSANDGGGATFCTLNNCTLTGNSASGSGGGVRGGTLNNCTLTGNSAADFGGGAYAGTLNNCTLTGNSAGISGGGANGVRFCGAFSCFTTGAMLNNCIVYFNSAPDGPNFHSSSTLNYCCTTPMPTNGVGNITNEPIFVDLANSNSRLQSNSPCINAGNNAYAPSGPDLDVNPRIAVGTVDIGAYEFQTPTSLISYAWLQQFGLPLDGSADNSDPDGDHFTNFHEWRAGTDPTNPLSLLRLLTPVVVGNTRLVSWQSTPDRTYTLERSTNLNAAPHFAPLATGIPGSFGTNTTTFSDTNAIIPGPYLYRVRVEE